METKREYQKIRRPSPVMAESTGEHTLPDYNPDVRKLVHTAARLIQGARFTDGERTELPVTVLYDVIYLDGDGGLNHTDFTSDAELAMTLGEGVSDSCLTPELLGYTVRLTGPRRFSARASLAGRLSTKESATLDVEGDTFTVGEAQVSEGRASVMNEAWAESEGEVNGEIWSREGAVLDEVKILLAEATGNVDSVRLSDGNAEVKGEIKLGLLLSFADECPEYIERRMPVSDSIPIDSDGVCRAEIKINEITPTVHPNEEGVSIDISLKYGISVACLSSMSVSVVKDCFSRSYGTRNEYGEMKYDELLAAFTHSQKIADEIDREGILTPDTRNLVYTSATARTESVEILGSSLKIQGKMKISGIACEAFADGSLSYTGMKLEVPYNTNVNLDLHLPDDASCDVKPHVTELSVVIDGERIYVNAEVTSFITLYTERRIGCIASSFITEEKIEHDPSVITVYYPERGETLFGIAKRHHASVLGIASDNSLSDSCLADPSSEGSLAGVKKLIIR